MTRIKLTISQAISDYLDSITLSRSENTARAYKNALNAFKNMLEDRDVPPDTTLIHDLTEKPISWFTTKLKTYSPATERLYLNAATSFYSYLIANQLADINMHRIRLLIRQQARRTSQRLPQFPREEIENLIDYVSNLNTALSKDEQDRLRNYRDRAFLITLADTGLRVHEACSLRRGDIDWNEGKAMVIGKGDSQAIIRFSSRALTAIKDYISMRASLDGSSGKALTSLPLFARHDRGAGKKVKPITTTTGRNIVIQRTRECLGDKAVGKITPHSFRHYFVTTVLLGSGGNLKLAQELARHKNIAVTQRYSHLADDELDKGYHDIFE
jgi:site-specific recombinase XerD